MRLTGEVTLPERGKTAGKIPVRNIKAAIAYLAPYRWWLLAAFLAMLVTSSTVLALGYGLRYFVDTGIAKADPERLGHAYRLFLGIILFYAAATYLRFILIARIGEQMVRDLRRRFFDALSGQDIAFFESRPAGDLLSRLSTDTVVLQTVLTGSVFVALRNIFLFCGGIALMLYTSPHLTAYVLLIAPMAIAPLLLLGRRLRRLARLTQERIGTLTTHGEEAIGAVRTIRALAMEERSRRHFSMLADEAMRTGMRRVHLKALLVSLVIACVFGSVLTVLWAGGGLVISGQMSPGELSQFLFYAVLSAGAAGAISEIYGDLQQAAGAAGRLSELLAIKPTITAPAKPVPVPEPLRGEVRFDKMGFSYPTRPDTDALHDFSLHIAPGETVALVGPSGAGKTTVMQLLLRFYDPKSGGITIDGIPLPSFDPVALRRHIGYVPQDPVMFSTDAWENIACGLLCPREAIVEAARHAEALEFLEAMPEGMATHLGEKGVRLSGGQKQRIAIARAMLRDPRILLLDEATSALDSENEQKVQEALARLMKGRTTLVIAHRLSTVRHADRIVVMEDGRIIATGNHDELLHTCNLYHRLAAMQFSG